MKNNKLALAACCTLLSSGSAIADELTEALKSGKVYGDLRLRYESVEQDNALQDADALTLRTRLGYNSGDFHGFSATLEMEDTRIVLGQGDYSVPPTGFNTGVYSVIADPETTELDQGYIKYQQDKFSAKLGRQVLTFDNHRFVGHVGWRQDRQTFDGLSLVYQPVDDLTLNYAYLEQRNRIFAEAADIDSQDHLLNAKYKTPYGSLVGYAYLLEVDNNTDNALDTYGLRFSGATKGDLSFLYTLEFATQTLEQGSNERDTQYNLIEAGLKAKGVTAKLGYEVLGSDDGTGGFATPLATLHKFNGWSDQFLGTPAQGLVDLYVSFSGKLAGGKWAAAWHDFSADESTATIDDLGTELNLLYARKFAKNYSTGIKYASYSAGDSAAGKVDTDKLWLWAGVKF